MAANRCDDLTPALRAVQDDWTAKFKGEGELGLEDFAHERRNVSYFEAVEANLANPGTGVGEERQAKLLANFQL